MNTPITVPVSSIDTGKRFAILVNSIGQSGAGLVAALKQISPLSEQKIASLLYQTPTKLFTDLPEKAALEIHQILLGAGLECEVIGNELEVEVGDANHEVALVVKDVSRMTEIAQMIMGLVGADIDTVRAMLFTTPTVLLGKISRNTALSIRQRFEPLGVEVDISNPTQAIFDVFLGECSEMDQHRLKQIFEELGIELMTAEKQLQQNSLISAGLSKEEGEKIWEKMCRTHLPIRIVNRDFERFDLQLLSLPSTPEALQFLTESCGMPAHIAPKVLQKLPIVIQQNISFEELRKQLSHITALGGKAIGNLLVFQTFSLQLETIKDVKQTVNILEALGQKSKPEIIEGIQDNKRIEGPFGSLQVRWIQHELKKIGTTSSRILR